MQNRNALGGVEKLLKIGAIGVAFFVFGIPTFGNARVIVTNSVPGIEVLNNTEYSYGVKPSESFLPEQPVFKVVYTDDDNDAPFYLNVVVNGIPHPMTLAPDQEGEYFDGLQYVWDVPTGTIGVGAYSYYFEVSDGQYTYPWMSSEFGDIINYARMPEFGSRTFEIKAGSNDPVIIIPGIMGSEQKNGVWIIDPILHTYDNLIDTFKANGYVEGVDLFTFPYQWRDSNVGTAILLKNKIDEIKAVCNCGKVDLVAHSMGGLVARKYIQSDDYEQDVDQLIFLGTPHLGGVASYLTWEAGETGRRFPDRVLNFIFTREAKKAGYFNLFDYVIHRPVFSVKELLPVYDYLEDKDTNTMRQYPNNYPRNLFLEELNSNVDKLYNSGVAITNIVGDLGSNSTLNVIRVVDSPILPLWDHGFPDGYDGTTSDLGLEVGSGDGTVPSASGQYVFPFTTISGADHNRLPTIAEARIINDLADIAQPALIDNWHFPDIILIIKMMSPADMVVIAPDGKKIGKDFNSNQEINEIAGAFYSGFNSHDEYITIPNPLDGEYRVETIGTDNGGEYTVATGLISDTNYSEHDFVATTLPGMITSLNIEVSNASSSIEVVPEDNVPPIISFNSPISRDYTRSEVLVVDTTSTDAGTGVLLHVIAFDDKIISNGDTIDLFFQHLGNHTLYVTSTDFVGNTANSSTEFRIIATASSTINDVERAYNLGWITKEKVRDELKRDLNRIIKIEKRIDLLEEKLQNKPKVIKQIERAEKIVDRILAKQLLRELDRYQSKGWLNSEAYNLLTEDINWLLNN